MTTLNAQIPDTLYKQISELAKAENIPLDQLVAISLSAQVSSWMTKDYLEERANKGSWKKFQKVLKKVKDVEPEEYDKI